jgi:hypothetical protein
MKPVALRVPCELASNFFADLTASHSAAGVDARRSSADAGELRLSGSVTTVYVVELDDSFFERFPQWRMYVEQ